MKNFNFYKRIIYNLKNNHYKIEFIKKYPFRIFKIDNFFNDDEYFFFKKAFLDVKELNNYKVDNTKYKLSYNSSEKIYKDINLKNQSSNDFHKIVFNKFFINYFYRNLLFDYILSRIDDPIYLIKLLRPKINLFEKRKFNMIEKIFFSKTTPKIEYSYMLNKSRIDPHTDFSGKLVSLMLYFPDENLDSKAKLNLGTTFYKSKKKDIRNIHLDDAQSRSNFYENSKKLLQLPFEKKTLFGFIKSKKSWHSVEEINQHNKFVRKSININLYL